MDTLNTTRTPAFLHAIADLTEGVSHEYAATTKNPTKAMLKEPWELLRSAADNGVPASGYEAFMQAELACYRIVGTIRFMHLCKRFEEAP